MFYANLENQSFPHTTGKIVCVGRNYAEHAKELNNPVPSAPILFIKPADAAVNVAPSFTLPEGQGSVHHELEIAVLIGDRLSNADEADVAAALAGAWGWETFTSGVQLASPISVGVVATLATLALLALALAIEDWTWKRGQ